MNIDTSTIVSVTEVNQNFSKVMKLVEQNGQAVIFKNNRPRYMMLDINSYESIDKAIKQMKEYSRELRQTAGGKGARNEKLL